MRSRWYGIASVRNYNQRRFSDEGSNQKQQYVGTVSLGDIPSGEEKNLDHIEEDHGKRLARIESKQDGLEGHFKKGLDGQRKMLEILERRDDKPTYTTGRPG